MTSNAKSKAGSSTADGDQELIRDLAHLLNETGLSEIEIERSGLRLRVAKATTVAATVDPGPVPAPAPAAQPTPAPAVAEATTDPSKHPGAVKSPMVGTVYRAAEPGAANFVEVGSTVAAGQTLLIIEAMKTMNQIQAPKAGTVTQILCDNEQPVEFDQVLVLID